MGTWLKNLIPGDTIKAVKPGDPRARLNDGQGLYLPLFVEGGAHGWRFDYSIGDRRKTLSLGTYSDTSLKLARQKADEYRKLVAEGTDQSDTRKPTKTPPAFRWGARPPLPVRYRCTAELAGHACCLGHHQ